MTNRTIAPVVSRLAARWLLCLGTALLGTLAQGEGRVLVGMTAPLSGSNGLYGQALLHGVRMGLAQSAPKGVELQVMDDAGDPRRTVANASALIEAGAVALTAAHGARPAEAMRSVLARSGVPLVGVASSADSLRNPPQREVFNLRAGAGDEADVIVLHLDTLNIERIAALAEDDTLGASGMEQLKFQLIRLAMQPVALESLPVGAPSAALSAAMRRICDKQPQAVLLAVQAKVALAAVSDAPAAGCVATQFVAFSETGAALALEAALPLRMMVSQVLPHPLQTVHPLAVAYKRALGPDTQRASYPSLEGYLYGRVLGEVLGICVRRATPSCLIEALEARPPQIEGWRLRFSRDERRGSRYVDLTLIDKTGRITR